MQKDLHFRFFSVADVEDAIDEENRTIKLAFSSETPYKRQDGFEILGHKSGEVDLSFLISGSAPLLADHDPEKQIGVIKSVLIENGVGRAVARFGRNGLAKDYFEDVVDGIRKNISVGYIVKETGNLERNEDGSNQYRVTKWIPKEISVVSIPADESVGVGRSDNTTQNNNNNKEIITMDVKNEKVEDTATQKSVDVEELKRNTIADEQKRMRGINAVAKKFNKEDEAEKFISDGKSESQFRAYVMDNMDTPKAPVQASADIGLSENERQKYSIMNLVRAAAFPEDRAFQKAAEFEKAASKAAAENMKDVRGLVIPMDILTRDLTVGVSADGGDLVATELQPQNFIDLLRNKMVINGLGAQTISGLVGNVAFPRQTSAGSAYWVAENGAPTESQQAIAQVSMTPKTVGAFTDFSRSLLMQSSIGIEQFVMNDLMSVLAIELDRVALYGTGAANQPTGIVNTAGINAPAPFAVAVPTFAEMVAMETAVDVDNANVGNLAYVTDPTTRGGLKTLAKDSGSGIMVWENNTVNGYKAEVSNQVVAGDVFYGNFADLLLGLWGGLDITVDPYSLSTSGGKRIVAFQSADIAVRNPVSFAFNNDTI